jgi:hypothetical protein
MKNWYFGAIVLVLLVSACAQFPYREKGLDPVKVECPPAFYAGYSDGQKIDDAVVDGDKSECWKRSIEEHVRYDLMFVEFDDQGWVQQSSKLPRPGNDYFDAFFAQLEKLRAKYQAAGHGLSLVVYVHGWHHNAHANDENVRAFRKLLGDVALAEGESGTARRVVGIYVGWRGDSITSSWINWITFWDRKNTAERVSQGMVREFFSRLDYFRDRTEKQAGNQVTRMLVIGHSFGGLIVYESLSSEFLRASARYRGDDDSGNCPKTNTKPRYLSRFGDLVVIVNPAFEGTRYEPLKVSAQRLRCLNETQLPLVIIATSQADLATKNVFPVARYFNTIFEWTPDDEQDANVRTVGHNSRYTTHNLSLCAKDDVACANACKGNPSSAASKGPEQRTATIQERKENITKEQQRVAAIEKGGFESKEYFCGGQGQEFNLQLSSEGQWHPKANPFWVVHTTADIMDGHNDIFNPRFEAFIRQMYIRALSNSERTGRQAASD